MKKTTFFVALNGIVAALYFILTYCIQPFAFSSIFQIRISEALTLLPYVFGNSYVGLGIGCFFANLGSPFGIWDAVLGSLVTLIAGFLTSKIKSVWLAPLPPILLNALLLPLIWMLCGDKVIYLSSMLSLLLTQSVTIYIVGIPFVTIIKKHFNKKQGKT